MTTRTFTIFLLSFTLVVAGCATLQQLAIKADMAYSTAVFGLDDAEFAACHPVPAPPLTMDLCGPLDVKTVQALQDVKSVTVAIQKFPTTVPTSLPALLSDLNSVQISLVGLEQNPLIMSLAAKTAEANAKAIALLTLLTGGTK